MICNTCKTEVPSSFEHAIVNNQCPKCGHEIMSVEKMEAFRFLKKDLSKITMSMNAEETMDRIVTHLIYNYQIRPLQPLDIPDGPPRMIEGPPPPSISSRQPGGLPPMPPDTGNAAIDALKHEVYREMLEQQKEGFAGGMPNDPYESEGVMWDSGEDDGDLVARLKAKAGGRNKFINKQGTRVQRCD